MANNMSTINIGFAGNAGGSCNIGLGSPHFGHGVYFKELLTGSPLTMLGVLVYTIER